MVVDLPIKALTAETPVVDPLPVSLNTYVKPESTEETPAPMIQPGMQVFWRTSLNLWVVEVIEGAIAHIRQLSVWASQIATPVPVSELKIAGKT